MSNRKRTPLHPVQVFRTKALVQALLTNAGKSLTAIDDDLDCRSDDADSPKLLHKWARGEHLPCSEQLDPLWKKPNRIDELDRRYPGVARWFRHAFWFAVWKQALPPTLLELNLWMLRITHPLDEVVAMMRDPDTLTRLSYQRLSLKVIDRFEVESSLDMLGVIMLLIREKLLFREADWFATLKRDLQEFYPKLKEWPVTQAFADELIQYIETTYPDNLDNEPLLPRPQTGKLLQQPFSVIVV